MPNAKGYTRGCLIKVKKIGRSWRCWVITSWVDAKDACRLLDVVAAVTQQRLAELTRLGRGD